MKILCSVVLLCATIRLTEAAEATRLVFTKQGPVRGRRIEVRPDLGLGKVDAFFGLPYASPPTGQFRFMPPMVRFMFRKCLFKVSFEVSFKLSFKLSFLRQERS